MELFRKKFYVILKKFFIQPNIILEEVSKFKGYERFEIHMPNHQNEILTLSTAHNKVIPNFGKN